MQDNNTEYICGELRLAKIRQVLTWGKVIGSDEQATNMLRRLIA